MYLVAVAQDPGPTPLDSDVLDLTEKLRTDVLVDVAKVVTALGAFPTVAGLVAATAALFATRGRYAEAMVLVLGLVLIYIAVNVTKEVLERPRPPDPLVQTSGDAYPSGHSAYATAWVAAAVALTRRLRLVTSGVLVFVALGIAAAVGATRIYLGAHWFSDVAGGWGLGAGIFAVLGGIALVVEYIRHNGFERAGEAPESAAARGT
jgi:membrane-associated phospholipid phosphatase